MIDLLFNDPEGLVSRAAFNERFGILNQLYRYWWKQSVVSVEYVEKISDANVQVTATGQIDEKEHECIYISYNSSIVISESGEVSLAPGSSSKKLSGYQFDSDYYEKSLSTLKGKYASIQGSIYYFADDATCSVSGGINEWHFGVRTVTAQKVESGYSDYIFSTDRDAYPDSGIQNGYEYQYLGIPFENARECGKIETGSYVGTGTYGANNPCSLTFDFVPKLVLIIEDYKVVTFSEFINSFSYDSGNMKVTFLENTLSWYHDNSDSRAIRQLNKEGKTYPYIAF